MHTQGRSQKPVCRWGCHALVPPARRYPPRLSGSLAQLASRGALSPVRTTESPSVTLHTFSTVGGHRGACFKRQAHSTYRVWLSTRHRRHPFAAVGVYAPGGAAVQHHGRPWGSPPSGQRNAGVRTCGGRAEASVRSGGGACSAAF